MFEYMASVDEALLSFREKEITTRQSSDLLGKWAAHYPWEKIKNELYILSRGRNSSDPVLKLLSEPVRLEFLAALSIKSKLPNVDVKPNYKCDDTGLPTSTAIGGCGDIECFEEGKGVLVEVTMACGRTQTVMEIWPIKRHLEDFANKYGLVSQAIFVAPDVYVDSKEQISYVKFKYDMDIRPYKIDRFSEFLESCTSLYSDPSLS